MSTDPAAGVATVAEVCETHAGAQDKPATQATYRSRLRPVTDRWGALTAAEAVARLPEMQGELTTALGEERTRKTLTLLKKALARAGHDPAAGLIGLVAARDEHHVAITSLQALVDHGKIRYREKHAHGRGTTILFDRAELAEDLAALKRCPAEGCEKPGTGASGYCGDHFGEAGRKGAAIAESDLLEDPERNWYTAREGAGAAPCSLTLVLEAIADGTLPAVKVGRHWHISKSALHEWAASLRPASDRLVGVNKPSAEERAYRRGRVRQMHAAGISPGAIAEELDVSKPTVYSDVDWLGLERHGQGRSSRRLPPSEREERKAHAAALYRAGNGDRSIAAATDSSPTQVRRDLEALGVEIRPPGRQPKYPAPKERECGWCKRLFEPEHPSFDWRDGEYKPMRFCTDDHARDWRAAAGRAALAERGLLGADEIGKLWEIGAHQVQVLIAKKRLASERVIYPGGTVHGVKPREVERFELDLVRSDDGRRTASLEPDKVVAAADRNGRLAGLTSTGLSLDAARDVVRVAAERRRSRFVRHQRGRKPGPPSPRSLRWLERFKYHRAEQERHYAEFERQYGDKLADELAVERPTAWQAFQAVAEEDWLKHPEDWPRDNWWAAPGGPDEPDSLHPRRASDAAKRVRDAVKRLQIALA